MDKTGCFYDAFVERTFNESKNIISSDFIGSNYLEEFVSSYLNNLHMNGFESAVFSNLNLIYA